MSLNRKNCLGFGFFRHILVKTPSPTKTLPDTARGCNIITLKNNMNGFLSNAIGIIVQRKKNLIKPSMRMTGVQLSASHRTKGVKIL